MDRSITMQYTEPQAEFHALKTKFSLLVGGYGSGKSECLTNESIIDASVSATALIALYEPTYDLARLILIPRLTEKLIDFGIAYKHNKLENMIYTSASGFGDFVIRTLDNPGRIIGYESYRAHIDELDTLPTHKAAECWGKIVARNRQLPKGAPKSSNRVSAYTTPEGFKFAYDRFVKRGGKKYGIVHAPSYSNPWLEEDYLEGLRETYDGPLIESYIEGKFVNLTGGNVYSTYNREAHRSFERIDPRDTLHIGCDFNVDKQAATIYVTRKGGEEWHAVAELVDMHDTPNMIDIIKEKWPEHKIIIYPDASGGSRKSVNASISDLSLLSEAGFEIRAKKSNPLVRDRINATNVGFSKGRIYINDVECPRAVECLEQQGYDKNGEPDKKSGVDHQNDATTYPIAYMMPIRKPIAHIKVGYM